MRDAYGVQSGDAVGVDTLMWASCDFPHSDGTCPRAREIIESVTQRVTAGDRRVLLCGNVAEPYGRKL